MAARWNARLKSRSLSREGTQSSAPGIETQDCEENIQSKPEVLVKPKLTDAQRAKIERNRQKALLLKQARLAKRPQPSDAPQKSTLWAGTKSDVPKKVIDTGGGFLLDEEEEQEVVKKQKVVYEPGTEGENGAILDGDSLICDDCGVEFMESSLYASFDALICNQCREKDDTHKLITKTDAKNKYLLRDADLEVREPSLKYIVRKNPRHDRWGDMKLYLEEQVEKRALEVWGSEEKMEERREQLAVNRQKLKQKRYDKRVKELRKAVRSSLYQKDLSAHEHEYGPETFNDTEDTYSKTCQTCGQSISYEKM